MLFKVEFTREYTILQLQINNENICELTYILEKNNTIYLYSIYTNEKYRYKGYATLTMNYFVECFKYYNILVKILTEHENIPLMKLLKKYNFEELILANEPFLIKYAEIDNDIYYNTLDSIDINMKYNLFHTTHDQQHNL